MKSKLLIGILICFLLSCNKFESKQKRIFNSENFNNYEIEFSNLDYNFNLNSEFFLFLIYPSAYKKPHQYAFYSVSIFSKNVSSK